MTQKRQNQSLNHIITRLLAMAPAIVITIGLNVAAAYAVEQESPHITQLRDDAEAGKVEAQDALAYIYLNGSGVPKNPAEALRLWKLAAEQGKASAISRVGTMYYQGLGVTKDTAEAIRWWQKAAEKHDADAQAQLGFAYLLGDSVPRSHIYAYMWFNLAAANGDTNSAKNRDSVAKEMSGDMIGEAQRITNEWSQQHPGGVQP